MVVVERRFLCSGGRHSGKRSYEKHPGVCIAGAQRWRRAEGSDPGNTVVCLIAHTHVLARAGLEPASSGVRWNQMRAGNIAGQVIQSCEVCPRVRCSARAPGLCLAETLPFPMVVKVKVRSHPKVMFVFTMNNLKHANNRVPSVLRRL